MIPARWAGHRCARTVPAPGATPPGQPAAAPPGPPPGGASASPIGHRHRPPARPIGRRQFTAPPRPARPPATAPDGGSHWMPRAAACGPWRRNPGPQNPGPPMPLIRAHRAGGGHVAPGQGPRLKGILYSRHGGNVARFNGYMGNHTSFSFAALRIDPQKSHGIPGRCPIFRHYPPPGGIWGGAGGYGMAFAHSIF